MKKTALFTSIVLVFFFTSCSNDTNKEHSEKHQHDAMEKTRSCFYTFSPDSTTTVSWTAFKTSEKIGVGGKFDEVTVTAGGKTTKITDLLQEIKFSIATNSVNTENPERDKKIVDAYFGTMESTDLILGQVKTVEGDNDAGSCTFFLTLNNVEKEVVLNYAVQENKLTLTGEMDILNWNAENALEALNDVCKDLHKGADGKSVTWPNVALLIETHLTASCK